MSQDVARSVFTDRNDRVFAISAREEAAGCARQYCEIVIVLASCSKHLVSKEVPITRFWSVVSAQKAPAVVIINPGRPLRLDQLTRSRACSLSHAKLSSK